MNYYIGDWHFGHKNIIRYDKRPFSTVESMNEELIKRWNSVVSPKDTVYVLGDMFFNATTSERRNILNNLKGRKVLIKGNHDYIDHVMLEAFDEIKDYKVVKDGHLNIVLSHYPMPWFENHLRESWVHFYAHVHTTSEYYHVLEVQRNIIKSGNNCKMYNVGAMMPYMDYTPRTAGQIICSEY